MTLTTSYDTEKRRNGDGDEEEGRRKHSFDDRTEGEGSRTAGSVDDDGRRLSQQSDVGEDGIASEEEIDQSYSIRISCNVVALILIGITIAKPELGGLRRTYNYRGYLFGIAATILGLVNGPWIFRKKGARISLVQVICNLFPLAGILYVTLSSDDDDISNALIYSFYGTIFVIINLPSIFPQ